MNNTDKKNTDTTDPFIIIDEETGEKSYGGNQAWFPRQTMTYAGCGVIAAANSLRELLCRNPGLYGQAEGKLKLLGNVIVTKAEYISVIEDLYHNMLVVELPVANLIYDKTNTKFGSKLFRYIPPSFGMSADSLIRGILRYARKNGVLLHCCFLSAVFTEYDKGLSFIKKGLKEAGAVILMTSHNKHSLTVYQNTAGETSGQGTASYMKTHFATITDVIYKNDEPVIKLSTWGKAATVSYKELFESWQKRRAYVASMFYFLPESSKAMVRADLRKSVAILPKAVIKTAAGKRKRRR
ncbi:MAG: hypothetical protein IJ873_09445 [Lachnospiraceae bacterium]|nr:hypothetical protein [Lachnospiraceae bacterium]MBR2276264.1 hypothetical protein [Lachnospiraceae bacterium]